MAQATKARRTAAALATALLFGALPGALLFGALPAAAQQGAGDPVPVILTPVERTTFHDRIESVGTLKASESVTLTVNVSEKIVDLLFDDGRRVEEGELLVVLEQAEERAAVDAAQAVLAERRAAFSRSSQLQQQQFATAAQLDERRAAMQQAEADLEIARARLHDRTIVAPFDGVIGLRNISVGTLVEPGDPIAVLSDISTLKLDFAVPSSFLAALRPGLAIRAKTTARTDRDFEGVVSSVDTVIDPVTRAITVRALVPNPEDFLRPGLVMTVELLKNPRNVLVVPEESLVPLDRRNFVFVAEPDGDERVARRREVTIGARRPGEVEIVEGLQEGQQIVVHGTLKVADGDPLRVLGVASDDHSISDILREQLEGRQAGG